MDLITLSRHPLYGLQDYERFNLVYEGGRRFIDRYLECFDSREEKRDFEKRKKLTYNPGFAAEALDEVKNGIYQRMSEIIRSGGTKSYNRAIGGLDGGVDLEGSNMDTFMGQKALPEMLKMGRSGIYVDNPKFNPNATLAEFAVTPHPYLYVYKAEDILNWRTFYMDNELVYRVVLLREKRWQYNVFGLPTIPQEMYRLVKLTDQGVEVFFFQQYVGDDKQLKEKVVEQYIIPGLKRIPFVPLDIGKSLLQDVADYQIGLMNLASADLNYAIAGNFPFYVEGYDPKTEASWNKQGPQTSFDEDGNPITPTAAKSDQPMETKVGVHHGRRYPYEASPPQFIHPSPEPLKASMEKQQQMQDEIKRLLNLSVSNVSPSRASAESKKVDQVGLESGLAAIGIELQGAEFQIAQIWAMYEQENQDQIVISYPKNYSLKTDGQRLEEAKALNDIKGIAPSRVFNKEVAKLAARSLLEGKISRDRMDSILADIDAAKYTTSNYEEIASDIVSGLVDAETASTARGYDGPAVVAKAHEERVKRMAEIAIAQTPGGGAGAAATSTARGGQGADTAVGEKTISQNPDKQPLGTTSTRGAA